MERALLKRDFGENQDFKMKKEVYRKGVFVVVYRKDNDKVEYLLFKRKLHWKGWEFSKGGCEAKETYRKCIVREVKEETGLKPKKISWYCKNGRYKYKQAIKDREGVIGQTYILTSCEVGKGRVKIDKKEHSGFKWVDYKTALKMLTYSNQRVCLRLVNKSLI